MTKEEFKQLHKNFEHEAPMLRIKEKFWKIVPERDPAIVGEMYELGGMQSNDYHLKSYYIGFQNCPGGSWDFAPEWVEIVHENVKDFNKHCHSKDVALI